MRLRTKDNVRRLELRIIVGRDELENDFRVDEEALRVINDDVHPILDELPYIPETAFRLELCLDEYPDVVESIDIEEIVLVFECPEL